MLRIIVAFTLLFVSSASLASLTITPTRVVFNDRDRIATMTLLNTSDKTVSYRLQWQELRFSDTGQLTLVEEPAAYALSKMMRISPRQVTLAPNQKQVIKLALRRPSDLPAGELRSYLNFSAQPVTAPEDQAQQHSGLKINLLINYNVPVIVRHQATLPELNIAAVEKVAADKLRFILERQGKSSSNGKVLAFHVDQQGQQREIALLNNINVYTEQQRIAVTLPLTETLPQSGHLLLQYLGSEEYLGVRFAEKHIPLPL
ncbi:fimbrial biogenesis chaperone [Pseudoalteromonas fenneropenaei]|uniref:fimbrial biogenesis chaperone n=1 Tax=Pseudoalteromonas fenneropenaei TaxID=1737459 RepID=UPI00367114B8